MNALTFLIPAGLFALISLPLIYLFHMRSPTPKTASVPSLRFWRVASPRPTEEPRFRRPPLSLQLLLQLGIAALLALALARPVTEAFTGALGSGGDPVHQIILLDGSTSMNSSGDIAGVSRFDQATAVARDRIDSLRAGDAVTVVLFGSRTVTRSAGDPATVDRIADEIESWTAPGGVADLTGVLLLAADLSMPGIENRLLLLSDGALAADPSAVQALGMAIEDRRLGPPSAANVAIVDVSQRNDPTRPAAKQVLASVANFGALPAMLRIDVSADGVPVTSRSIEIGANERRVELFDLPSNVQIAAFTLAPTDSHPLDDVATIQIGGGGFGSLDVLIFSDQPDPLARAFGALPGSQVTVETTDAARDGMGSSGYDLVVYDQVIPVSAPVSPALFVSPPDSDYFRSPGMLADQAIATSDPGDPLLNGVDLTGIVIGVTPDYDVPDNFRTPVSAADGPLVAYGTLPDSGLPAALLAMPLNAGNLTERIAFPILIANLAGAMAPAPPSAVLRVGDPLTITLSATAETASVTTPDGEQVDLLVPDASVDGRSVVFTGTSLPGIYLIEESDAAGELLSSRRVSVNAGSPAESDLRAREGLSEVLTMSEASVSASSESDAVSELWPLLAILALALVVVEWLDSIRASRRKPARVAVNQP